jgi:hypothetical protein
MVEVVAPGVRLLLVVRLLAVAVVVQVVMALLSTLAALLSPIDLLFLVERVV